MTMRVRSWLRAGLIVLTAIDLVPGVWAYFFPRSFYSDVPTVSADPPFSQHLMTDVGAFFVAQAVVMAGAAIVMEYRLVRVALAGYITFAGLHLAFHARHLAGMPRADAIALVILLLLEVVIPLALLFAARPLFLARSARDTGPGEHGQAAASGSPPGQVTG
jgi:hypothetical protein